MWKAHVGLELPVEVRNMSDENKDTSKKKTYTKKQTTMINSAAYHVFLKDYFDKMVEEGKFKKIEKDEAFGKYRDLTYELPNGNWAQLNPSSDVLDQSKPTTFREYNPETKQAKKNREGKEKANTIFDAMAYGLGIDAKDRWDKTKTWPKLRQEAIHRFGFYPGKQTRTYDEKIDKKATEELNKRRNLTDDEVKLDEEIRATMIKSMADKMIQSIQETGTLFGREPLDMPIQVSSRMIAHLRKPGEMMDKSWTLRDQGKFPGGDGELGETLETKNGKTIVRSPVMQGLLYVAAMQDGHKDKRYMEVNDMLNGTRMSKNGMVMMRGQRPWTPNFLYGGDFGFKKREGKEVPKVEKGWIQGQNGKGFSGFKIEPAQAKEYLTPAVWINHLPHDHLTIKNFVNVEDIAVRPRGANPNDHSDDKYLLPKTPRPGVKSYVVQKAIMRYGKSISDVEAFKKDPEGEMRKIIGIVTENSDIRKYGMKAFQRELTLDHVLRSCGQREGVVIPERDRAMICNWIKNDFVKENTKERGNRFIEATIAMDRNNAMLRGISEKEKAIKVQAAIDRPKFQNLSMEFKSDYTTRAGEKIPRGTGGPMSVPLEGEKAFKFLSDMCIKDKKLFDHPNSPEYGKSVRFDLKIGEQKFENIVLILGKLDTGNEDTVADSMVNVLTKQARDSAFQRETINKEFGEIEALKKSGFLKEDLKNMEKVDFVTEKRAAFQNQDEELKKTFAVFREDEVNYMDAMRIKGEPFENDNTRTTADVYRYEVPTQNESLLYEAYGTNNVIRIREPEKRLANLPNSLVVELRHPLEAIKGITDKDKIVEAKNEQGKVIYGDPVKSRERPTGTLEAIPYCNQEELEKVGPFEKKFTLDISKQNEDGSINLHQYSGVKARDMFLKLANSDEAAFEKEKEGFRSIRHIDPIHVTARWEQEPIFEKEERMGEKAFSNGRSLKEIISGQEEGLSEKGKEALSAMLAAEHIHEKYSPNRDLNAMLSKSEVLTQDQIEKIVNAPKKVLEYQDEKNLKDITQIDRLQTEAIVNGKETDQAIMDHIVDGMLKETTLRGQDAVKAMQEALQKERPGMDEEFKKSLERKTVQKKLSSTRGIKRRSSTQEQGR